MISRSQSKYGTSIIRANSSGCVPPSLGKLTSFKLLDLSSNKLIGKIPIQLTDLTSLAILNLSENYLFGQIPQGKQFNTFTSDFYNGNVTNDKSLWQWWGTTIIAIINHLRGWFQIWKWVSLESCFVGVQLWIHVWIGFELSCVLKWETKIACEK